MLLSCLANVRGYKRLEKWPVGTGVSKQVYYSVLCRLFKIEQEGDITLNLAIGRERFATEEIPELRRAQESRRAVAQRTGVHG